MTRLSNRQYPMLKAFALEGSGYYMSEQDAQHFDQRPFRSMLMRQYISFHPGHGFFITPTGRAAWREFEMTEIMRKHFNAPLTRYFEPAKYPARAALRLLRRAAA